ncbi:MAG TPA: Zn-dependent alcohol dehydrogenase [Acidimicrobiales bacterium]|nr:Zn-dependent alcohol dehydrogenase [Acidimicrobiales bacterium]
MQAAVLNSIPGELEIEDITIDTPAPREVLVRVAAAGVCHSDLHFVEGKYPYPTPCVLGHESAGVVEAVGDQVTYVQPGDHVITCLSVFCGECGYCLTGRPSLCQNPSTQRPAGAPPRLSRDGAPVHQFISMSSFAEQMLVHEHALVKVSKDIPLDRAALIGCGVTTGLGAVFNTARVPATSTVAVVGCGGVGLNCVQGAALAGANRIIAVDMNETKLKMAEQFGATDLVNASDGDAVAQVRELTDGAGVEYSFEAIGLKQTTEQAFGMLARGGTATVIGMIPIGTTIELHGYEFLAEKKIQGSTMGSNHFRVDMPRYVELYLQGRLKLDELVSARVPLSEVNGAFDTMRAGEVARTVITF